MSHTVLFSTQRLPGLDAMRGINIVGMVIFHFSLLYFVTPTSEYTRTVFRIGAMVAPMFLYLAGAGVWFMVQRYALGRLFKRGLFLIVLTLLISVLVKQRLYFEWTMIQDIGVAYVVMAIIARITRHRWLVLLVVYLASFFTMWANGSYIFGEFPPLLFAPYFIAGYGFCAICPTPGQERTRWSILLPIGLAMGLTVIGLIASTWATGVLEQFWVGVIERTGVLMALHFGAVYILRARAFEGRIGGTLVTLGQISLTCYYLQQVTLRVMQRFNFHPIIISPEVSHILVTSVMLVAIWTILKIWQRWNYALSLEWFMRRL